VPPRHRPRKTFPRGYVLSDARCSRSGTSPSGHFFRESNRPRSHLTDPCARSENYGTTPQTVSPIGRRPCTFLEYQVFAQTARRSTCGPRRTWAGTWSVRIHHLGDTARARLAADPVPATRSWPPRATTDHSLGRSVDCRGRHLDEVITTRIRRDWDATGAADGRSSMAGLTFEPDEPWVVKLTIPRCALTKLPAVPGPGVLDASAPRRRYSIVVGRERRATSILRATEARFLYTSPDVVHGRRSAITRPQLRTRTSRADVYWAPPNGESAAGAARRKAFPSPARVQILHPHFQCANQR